jgi:hypothetical protein
LVHAAIDHIVSLTVFLAALVIFVGLFSQTIQTSIIYQQHRSIATKCSDLLDNMLLNPGSPMTWGQSSSIPSSFGLQDPEFMQYQLSPFSFMRLGAGADTLIFEKTSPNTCYSSLHNGFGNYLIMPQEETLNYSSVSKLLGTNNTYGFQLTLTPLISVSIEEEHAKNPLELSINVNGAGFPLTNASISYCLVKVSLPVLDADYPYFEIKNGTVTADEEGFASVSFSDVTNDESYAFIAYAHLGGLTGIGHYERSSSAEQYIVPLVKNMAEQKVLIAHNYDLNASGSAGFSLKYNATFVILTEDFTLRELPFSSSGDSNVVGTVTSGIGNPYPEIVLPSNTNGILIITYQKNAAEGGIAIMPWGIGSLGYSLMFGGDPRETDWVSTDIRQVSINHIGYQVKLALWSYVGEQVIG